MISKFTGLIVTAVVVLLQCCITLTPRALGLHPAMRYAVSAPGQSATSLLLQVMTANLSQRASAGCGSVYIVRQGDTLSLIASRCSVDVRSLARTNGITLSTTIYPNQRLVLPKTTSQAATSAAAAPAKAVRSTSCSNPNTVKSGDTLSAIAQRCRVSVTSLKAWNNLASNVVKVGQKLATRAAVYTPGVSVASSSRTATPIVVAPPQPTPTPAIESPVSEW